MAAAVMTASAPTEAAPQATPRPAPAPKPVKLEVNNSGAWKTVARFDAGQQWQVDLAMGAAEALHRLNPTNGWRIVMDDALAEVLMRMDKKAVGVWRAKP